MNILKRLFRRKPKSKSLIIREYIATPRAEFPEIRVGGVRRTLYQDANNPQIIFHPKPVKHGEPVTLTYEMKFDE